MISQFPVFNYDVLSTGAYLPTKISLTNIRAWISNHIHVKPYFNFKMQLKLGRGGGGGGGGGCDVCVYYIPH